MTNIDVKEIISDETTNKTVTQNALCADCEKLSLELTKTQASFASLKTDLDKLKSIISDKISKNVFVEIERKINVHTKTLDTYSKKIFELENNVNTFTQQPISHSVIDAIRKQLSDEIMANVTNLMEVQNEKTTKLIDDKTTETIKLINNAKKFMYR